MISSAHRQPKIIAAKIIIEIKGFPWNHFFGSRAVRSGCRTLSYNLEGVVCCFHHKSVTSEVSVISRALILGSMCSFMIWLNMLQKITRIPDIMQRIIRRL